MPFFIIFIVIPLTEIGVFMAVGEEIGLMATLALSLFTAILGGAIVRWQGLKALHDIQASLKDGKLPGREIFHGLCLLVAGATLITPGFVTDAIGFMLLIPPFRDVLRDMLGRFTKFEVETFAAGNRARRPPPDVIEGEFERVDEREKP